MNLLNFLFKAKGRSTNGLYLSFLHTQADQHIDKLNIISIKKKKQKITSYLTCRFTNAVEAPYFLKLQCGGEQNCSSTG